MIPSFRGITVFALIMEMFSYFEYLLNLKIDMFGKNYNHFKALTLCKLYSELMKASRNFIM